MSVYSMTGYANAWQDGISESQNGGATTKLFVEIRSVNSRFLDLSFRMPDELRPSEPMLRERLTARFKRGKIELRAVVERTTSALIAKPSDQLLQHLSTISNGVAVWLPGATPLSVADVIRLSASDHAPDANWLSDIVALTDRAMESLLLAREREGAKLAQTLMDRVHQLRALGVQAEPLIPKVVSQQQKRFLDRWEQAMQATYEGHSEVAQDRALAEATAFAMRIDVAEELARLAAHLGEFERLLTEGGEVGKRLDFLAQELHREVNTLGSKSAALDLTRIALEMKVLIEQMREQIQNIE